MATKKKPVKTSAKSDTSTKSKASETKRHAFLRFVKTHKLLLFVLVILLAIVTWYVTMQIIIVYEKRQLDKAEASLALFTDELQKEFGPSVTFAKDKSCGYRSTVYITIPNNPACGIGYYGQIPVTSASQATEYANKIEDILDNNFEIDYKKDGNFKDGVNSNSEIGGNYIYTYLSPGLNCGLTIEYEDPEYGLNNYIENHEVIISYHCTDPDSHKAFYTVLD